MSGGMSERLHSASGKKSIATSVVAEIGMDCWMAEWLDDRLANWMAGLMCIAFLCIMKVLLLVTWRSFILLRLVRIFRLHP